MVAQSVSLLNKPLSDAIRRAQLWGDVSISSSLCVRPIDAVQALGFYDPYLLDPKYDFVLNNKLNDGLFPKFSIPASSLTNSFSDSITNHLLNSVFPKNLFFLRATPINIRVQNNSHHDYGWQDGPMIPNKGLQYYMNAGIYGNIGPIEFQYAPEIVYAENQDLPAPGVRFVPNNENKFYDHPDRFGTEPYQRSYLGQSYIKLNIGIIKMGLSSENIFWGPGMYTSISMSQNAPGMKHFSFASKKPIKTSIGTFEFQFITGKKRRSGYTWERGSTSDGSSLSDVVRDVSLDSAFNVFSGAVGVFNPKILPGFFIGLTRQVWTEIQPTNPRYFDYLSMFFSNPFRSAGAGTEFKLDQMGSIFVRYVMPESNSEIYAEYSLDDNRFDFEDLWVSPEHSRAYILGFHKIKPLKTKFEYIELIYEMTQIESSKEALNRIQFGTPIFYGSDYNHFGQNIGAGIGTGSNQWILEINHANKKRRLGFVFERVARNNDNLYRGLVPWVNTWYGFDFTKKYTEVSVGLNYQKTIGPIIFWSKSLITQTYNWNHWYDPAGSSSVMRANGYNLKSFNIFTGLTIML